MKKNYNLIQVTALIIVIIGAILAVYGRETNKREFGEIAFYGNIILSIGLLLSAIVYYFKKKNKWKLIGMLKTGIEIFKNHRKDKK